MYTNTNGYLHKSMNMILQRTWKMTHNGNSTVIKTTSHFRERTSRTPPPTLALKSREDHNHDVIFFEERASRTPPPTLALKSREDVTRSPSKIKKDLPDIPYIIQNAIEVHEVNSTTTYKCVIELYWSPYSCTS